jgi:hypothetical protein
MEGDGCEDIAVSGDAPEFIKWALTKEMILRLVEKHGLGSVTRQSVMSSPAYKQKMVINGVARARDHGTLRSYPTNPDRLRAFACQSHLPAKN